MRDFVKAPTLLETGLFLAFRMKTILNVPAKSGEFLIRRPDTLNVCWND
jgi:hypothetical protein